MRIPMSKKELNQIEVMEKLKREEISRKTAAKVIGRSKRTVSRKLKRYREKGPAGLAHRSRGRPGNRCFDPENKKIILNMLRTKYEGFGPTFASEKLEENMGIIINRETLRRFMIKDGVWQRKRNSKKHRKWRERKENYGQMEQLDGSWHKWIADCDEYWTLIKFIDDATGRVYARFYESESYASVADCTKRYIQKYGVPISIYADRGSVFKVNNRDDNDFITQYQRALSELDVRLIPAYSPQAKGRVERSFQTDQDRLVKEMKLRGIRSMDEANRFLEQEYFEKHNAKYSRIPKEKADLHRKCNLDLDDIFTVITERKVANDWTIRYKNKILQLDNKRPAIVKPKDSVTVHERLDKTIFITIRNERINHHEIQPNAKPDKPKVYSQILHRPSFNHPWKRTYKHF